MKNLSVLFLLSLFLVGTVSFVFAEGTGKVCFIPSGNSIESSALAVSGEQKIVKEKKKKKKVKKNQVDVSQEICIEVELAETVNEQVKGLQGRESVDENKGMLFVFDQPRMAGFWMKEMKIPLDMIWLDKDSKIVTLHQNVPPCVADPCVSYASRVDVLYVLEVKAGMVEKWGLKEGSGVRIELK